MKEKFTKLFGALILVALVLGLVLPFQTAAAQAEVPDGLIVTVTAGDGVGVAVDATRGGVPVTMTTGAVLSGTGTSLWATYTLWYSTTESGAKTMVASGILPATKSASYLHATPTNPAAEYTVTGLTPGKKYWFWAAACDTTTACTPQYGDTGYPSIYTTGAGMQVNPGYDNLPVTMTTTTTYGLVSGTIYKIFRRVAAASPADWPTTPATATALLTSTSPLFGTTVQLYDQTAAGYLLDGTSAKVYEYKLDICGPDYCASEQADVFTVTDTAGNQRTRPAQSVVTASDTTTDGKVYVTWSGSPSTGNTTYYAQRQFGAIFEPAVPVSFDQFTFNGVDSWAVANNVYTYWLWSWWYSELLR